VRIGNDRPAGVIGDSGCRALKALVVIDSLVVGGTEQSVADPVPGVVDAGIDATVVTLHYREPGYAAEMRRGGHDVRVLRAQSYAAKVRELRGLVRARAPDFVHTQLFDSDLAGRIADRDARKCAHQSGQHELRAAATPRPLSSCAPSPGRPAPRKVGAPRYLTDHFHAVSATGIS